MLSWKLSILSRAFTTDQDRLGGVPYDICRPFLQPLLQFAFF
jgi:hypothetical protein